MGAGHSNSIHEDEPALASLQDIDIFSDEDVFDEGIFSDEHISEQHGGKKVLTIQPVKKRTVSDEDIFADLSSDDDFTKEESDEDSITSPQSMIALTELFAGIPQPKTDALANYDTWKEYLITLFKYLANLYSKKLHPHSELTMQKFKKLPVVTQFRLHTWSNIGGIEIIDYLTQELDLAKKAFTAAFQFDFISNNNYQFNKVQAIGAMLAMTIQAFSRIFAEWLGDIRSEEQIGMLLIKYLKLPIETIEATASETSGEKNSFLQVLQIFLIRNPVARSLHLELHPILAAQKIVSAAKEAGIAPLKLFAMYCQKFLIEITAFAGKYHVPEIRFDTSFSAGIYSLIFVNTMLSSKPHSEDSPAFEFSEKAKEKLIQISEELKKTTPTQITDDATQLAYFFQEVDSRDATLKSAAFQGAASLKINLKEKIIEGLAWQLNVPVDRANSIYEAIITMISNAPVTITLQLAKVYSGDEILTELKPATTELSEIPFVNLMNAQMTCDDSPTDESVQFAPYWKDQPDFQPRGETYRMFREAKDTAALNGFQLSPIHKPLFGALNYSFYKSMAASLSSTHVGENYYGNVHFLLKREPLKDSMIYTATDFGIPRREPELLLYDFLYADTPGESIVPEKQVNLARTDDVKALAASALKNDFFTGTHLLRMEIQIFKNVPINQEYIECIVLGGGIAPATEDILYKEYDKHHVPVKVMRKTKNPGMPYGISDFEHKTEGEYISPPSPVELANPKLSLDTIVCDMDFETESIRREFNDNKTHIYNYWSTRLKSECATAPKWNTIQIVYHSPAFKQLETQESHTNQSYENFSEALIAFKAMVDKLVPEKLLVKEVLSMPLDVSLRKHRSTDQIYVLSVRKAYDDCLQVLAISEHNLPDPDKIEMLHNRINQLNLNDSISEKKRIRIMTPLLELWKQIVSNCKTLKSGPPA